MKCIVELFGNDRNGRKLIAWGRRIGWVVRTLVTCLTQNFGKLPNLFVCAFIHPADLVYWLLPC